MDCRDVQHLLHAYCDDELDLVRHLQVEHHLAECTGCGERERALRVLRTTLAAAPLYHRAPDALRARIEGAFASPPARPRRRRPWPTVALAATAAGIVLVVAATLTAGILGSVGTEDRLADRVIAGHIRSLQVDHVTDVPSSDRHTVKPWFQGKLDFAPQVPDLVPDGYPLTGGRLDYLTDRPVAALVYRRRQHVVNVFTWPAADDGERPVRSVHRQGFHIRSWQRAGMAYWVISDLNARELDDFAGLFREHVSVPAP